MGLAFTCSSLQNVHQAMVVLRDLLELQFTIADLERVPNLVATIRKVMYFALCHCHTHYIHPHTRTATPTATIHTFVLSHPLQPSHTRTATPTATFHMHSNCHIHYNHPHTRTTTTTTTFHTLVLPHPHTSLQLRHYHASQKVIKRADEVYHKLKGLHLRPNQVVVPSRKRSLVAGGVRQRLPIRTVTAPVATSSGGSITDVTSHKPSVHQEKLAMTPVMPTVLSNGMKEEPPSLRRSSRGTAQNKVDYSKMDQGSTESSGTEGNDQTVPM